MIMKRSLDSMSDLKKLYVAQGPGDAQVLKGLLESAGIRSVIRGDDFVPLQGGSFFNIETRPSIWVLKDEQFERAVEISNEYARRHSQKSDRFHATRVCSSCGEQLEIQFTECWKCGHVQSH